MFGVNQFYNGLTVLKSYDTKINIGLLHHPMSEFNEQEDLERCLNVSNISFYLFGHYHSNDFKKHYYGSLDNCFGIRGRASLNKINEANVLYMPGYQIIDLDFQFTGKITAIHYRRYKYETNRFDHDIDACTGGIDKGKLNKGIELKCNLESKTHFLDKRLFQS